MTQTTKREIRIEKGKEIIETQGVTHVIEPIELPGKLLDCFLWSNKSNINRCCCGFFHSLWWRI